MSESIQDVGGGGALLWDVLEEHVDEAGFGVESLERALDSPVLTLDEVERGPEERLRAHVDGLHVGGPPAFDRLLAPMLAAPRSVEPARLIAAAIVAIEQGRFDHLSAALAHEDAAARSAVVRACSLAQNAVLDKWVRRQLDGDVSIHERAALLSTLAHRHVAPPTPLVEWLQSDSIEAVKAAAEAARLADPQRHLPVMLWLLHHHPDQGVREAALVTAWMWGSREAAAACERWALDTDRVQCLAMALYAALGDRRPGPQIARHLARPSHRRAALFALGLSGDVTQLAVLAEQLDADDPIVARLAAQAIGMIIGCDCRSGPLARAPPPTRNVLHLADPAEDPEAMFVLPPLEEDDLDADLVPPPEYALPAPNAAAIRKLCAETASSLSASRRYLGGRAFDTDAVSRYLERGPMRCRHAVALAFAIRTRGGASVDTRAPSYVQRRQVAALRVA